LWSTFNYAAANDMINSVLWRGKRVEGNHGGSVAGIVTDLG
jgi:hypothetical protein